MLIMTVNAASTQFILSIIVDTSINSQPSLTSEVSDSCAYLYRSYQSRLSHFWVAKRIPRKITNDKGAVIRQPSITYQLIQVINRLMPWPNITSTLIVCNDLTFVAISISSQELVVPSFRLDEIRFKQLSPASLIKIKSMINVMITSAV